MKSTPVTVATILALCLGAMTGATAVAQDLKWYKHRGVADGRSDWDGPSKVGSGWRFKTVVASSDGVFYAVHPNGDLHWYKHTGVADGHGAWAPGTGDKVGSGWGGFVRVIAAPGGVLYAIKTNGDLLWFKHEGFANGKPSWAPGAASKVGAGWAGFQKVVAAEGGVLYAITTSGDLLWFKHSGAANGKPDWAKGTGNKVGSGWGDATKVVAVKGGVLYAIVKDGGLRWYKHTGAADGSFKWGSGTGYKVGSGWGGFESLLGGDDGALYVIDTAEEVVAAPKNDLEAAKALVERERAKRDEAAAKLKGMASSGGKLGVWTTKRVCAPLKVTIKGTCKTYATVCGKWAAPKCSGPIWRLRCSSPCARWDRTNTCILWLPDGVTTQDKCSDVPFFDVTQGTLWTKFKSDAEAAFNKAKAALDAKVKEIEAKRKADPCGAKGQRACKLWERVPSCDKGLLELGAKCIPAGEAIAGVAKAIEKFLRSAAKQGSAACKAAFRALPTVDFKVGDLNYGAACGKEFFMGFTCSIPKLLNDFLGLPMLLNRSASKGNEKPCSTMVQPMKSLCALGKIFAADETVAVIKCIVEAIRSGIFKELGRINFDELKLPPPKPQRIPVKMCGKLGELAFKIAKMIVLKKLNERYNKKSVKADKGPQKGKGAGKNKGKDKKETASEGNAVIKLLLKFHGISMVAKKVVYLTRSMEALSACQDIGPMLRSLRAEHAAAGLTPRVPAQPIYGLKKDGTLHWYGHKGYLKGTTAWTGPTEVAKGWKPARPAFASSRGVVYTIEPNGDLMWHRDAGYLTGKPRWTKKRVARGWGGMRRVFAAANGLLYAVRKNGDLYWYKHEGYLTGAASWTIKKVGTGWADFADVVASSGGVVYALKKNGDLLWYKHEGYRTGTISWQSRKVASGWSDVRQFVAASGGRLYVIRKNGDLYWHRHEGLRDGSPKWKSAKVGSGWEMFERVFAAKAP